MEHDPVLLFHIMEHGLSRFSGGILEFPVFSYCLNVTELLQFSCVQESGVSIGTVGLAQIRKKEDTIMCFKFLGNCDIMTFIRNCFGC